MTDQTTNPKPNGNDQQKEDEMTNQTQTAEVTKLPVGVAQNGDSPQRRKQAKDGKPTRRKTKATKARGRQTVTTKAQAKAPPKREGSMAEWLDQQLQKGITWDALLKAAQAEAEKRGVKTFTRMGEIKAHANFRAKSAKWNVEMDDKKVKMAAAK